MSIAIVRYLIGCYSHSFSMSRAMRLSFDSCFAAAFINIVSCTHLITGIFCSCKRTLHRRRRVQDAV